MTFKIGQVFEDEVVVTDKMVKTFAEITGDNNPVHLDDDFAKNTRFGKRIAHGILTAGFISASLARHLGQGGIYLAQTLKFQSPVFVGDKVKIILKVTSRREEKGIGLVETTVQNLTTGEISVKGEATIMESWAITKKSK